MSSSCLWEEALHHPVFPEIPLHHHLRCSPPPPTHHTLSLSRVLYRMHPARTSPTRALPHAPRTHVSHTGRSQIVVPHDTPMILAAHTCHTQAMCSCTHVTLVLSLATYSLSTDTQPQAMCSLTHVTLVLSLATHSLSTDTQPRRSWQPGSTRTPCARL